MKQHFYTLFAAFSLLGLMACEKIIDIELPDNEPLLVVESQISNVKDLWSVKLSSSQDYFEKDGQLFIDNASVSIQELNGSKHLLTYKGNGTYSTDDSLICNIGGTYTLSINWNNQTFTATETCRPQLTLDTFAAYFLPENNGFIPSGWYAFIGGQEWPGSGDHYQWILYKNDTVQEGFGGGYIVDSDEFVEFGYFNAGIDPADPLKGGRQPRPIGGPFESGDRLKIEQRSISKNYFDFLNDISTQRDRPGSPFDAPPANPKGNVDGAIGFFSVVNTQIWELIVE